MHRRLVQHAWKRRILRPVPIHDGLLRLRPAGDVAAASPVQPERLHHGTLRRCRAPLLACRRKKATLLHPALPTDRTSRPRSMCGDGQRVGQVRGGVEKRERGLCVAAADRDPARPPGLSLEGEEGFESVGRAQLRPLQARDGSRLRCASRLTLRPGGLAGTARPEALILRCRATALCSVPLHPREPSS